MENKNEYIEAALIAGAIALIGDVVCSQGPVVALTEAALVAAFGGLAAWSFLRGQTGRARVAGAKALTFAAVLVLARGFDFANNRVARGRAETIVAACDAYKIKTGVYPDSLQALVPDYLPAVPRAKFTVLWGAFQYGGGRLAWTVVPLAVTPSYDLAAAKWSFGLRDALPAFLGQ